VRAHLGKERAYYELGCSQITDSNAERLCINAGYKRIVYFENWNKDNKLPPKIVYRYGKQSMEIKIYLYYCLINKIILKKCYFK
jgi:hypothetical protein